MIANSYAYNDDIPMTTDFPKLSISTNNLNMLRVDVIPILRIDQGECNYHTQIQYFNSYNSEMINKVKLYDTRRVNSQLWSNQMLTW